MANISGFGFSGLDHGGTIFESANNYLWNKWSANDAQDRAQENAAYNAALNYEYYIKGLKEAPSAQVEGLENAGLNPILAANSSAGAFSAGANASSPAFGDAGHGGSSAAGNPLQIAQTRAAIAQSNSAARAQSKLADLYEAQAQRQRFVPITDTNSGGASILGTGFNTGQTDTLLYDTESGRIIHPKYESHKTLPNEADSTLDQFINDVNDFFNFKWKPRH